MVDIEDIHHAYLHLVRCAMERRTTTYEELAEAMRLAPEEASERFADVLNSLMAWCKKKSLPYYPVLVRRASGADEGYPARGFWQVVFAPGRVNGLNDQTRQLMMSMLTNQVFEYHSDISVGNPKIAAAVRDYFVDHLQDAPQEFFPFIESLQDNLRRVYGDATILINRNMCTMREHVMTNVAVYRWLAERGLVDNEHAS